MSENELQIVMGCMTYGQVGTLWGVFEIESDRELEVELDGCTLEWALEGIQNSNVNLLCDRVRNCTNARLKQNHIKKIPDSTQI